MDKFLATGSRFLGGVDALLAAGSLFLAGMDVFLVTASLFLATSGLCIAAGSLCIVTSCPCIVTSCSCIVTSCSCIVTSWSCLAASWSCLAASWSCLAASWSCLVNICDFLAGKRLRLRDVGRGASPCASCRNKELASTLRRHPQDHHSEHRDKSAGERTFAWPFTFDVARERDDDERRERHDGQHHAGLLFHQRPLITADAKRGAGESVGDNPRPDGRGVEG